MAWKSFRQSSTEPNDSESAWATAEVEPGRGWAPARRLEK